MCTDVPNPLDSKIFKPRLLENSKYELIDGAVDDTNRTGKIRTSILTNIFHATREERNPLKLWDVDVASD